MIARREQSGANGEAWEQVLASLCRFQSVLPEAVLAGGTAAARQAQAKVDAWLKARTAGETAPLGKLPGLAR